MPIYEYRCIECEVSFEAFVRPGHDDAQCPDCNGDHLTREMSTFAARSGNGNGAAVAAINGNGIGGASSSSRSSGGGCCGGGCGCH